MTGLYIHIPFCHARCYYCDFCSRAVVRDGARQYARLAERLRCEQRARLGDVAPDTIYIGGGTPSILPVEILEEILKDVPRSRCCEFTIEANPEDVTDSWAAGVRALGVDRVSMGIQSAVDTELRAIGRRHTFARAAEAVSALRRAGFHNISLDLIYGLPGQTEQSWQYSIERIIDLQPSHISAYHLGIEVGTVLARQLARGIIREADEELSARMYHALCSAMRRAGYGHYEISNFALPGCEALHNSRYWDGTPYIGIGPGAHSYVDGVRSYNIPDISKYLDEGYAATLTVDAETESNIINDTIVTALRTARGLSLPQFSDHFGAAAAQRLVQRARKALSLGHLVEADRRLVIPEPHWLISDAIIVDLLADD